ncbi:MAG: SDR family oxidoreductase [Bryobacteraceae bacterium]
MSTVAIVTGAARGIGRACALELAKRGSDLVLADIRLADDTARAVEALGRQAIALECDVADRDACARVVEQAVARFGRVDILLNNAAFGERCAFIDASEATARRTMEVIFWGTFHLTQFAARQMVKQGEGGAIVSISSVHASRPYANASLYNAAKAAVNHFTASIANELASHRIRVNAVEPGWIDTPGEREKFGDKFVDEGGAALPWGRLGQPEEIGRVVAFLASSDASYITGTVVRSDGGYVLAH